MSALSKKSLISQSSEESDVDKAFKNYHCLQINSQTVCSEHLSLHSKSLFDIKF